MLPHNITYEWVASHQDDLKTWEDLSLEEQLNTECDTLAKEAIKTSLQQPLRKQEQQPLPLEPASLSVKGRKQTGNPARAVRRSLEHKAAETFYAQELGWSRATFNRVNWEGLDEALQAKGDPFRLWLSKQVN